LKFDPPDPNNPNKNRKGVTEDDLAKRKRNALKENERRENALLDPCDKGSTERAPSDKRHALFQLDNPLAHCFEFGL
jgi:hypothetical protein